MNFMEMGLPFAHAVLAAATADQYALADGEAHEIRFYDWMGLNRRIARRPEVAGIPLTDVDKDRYIADRLAAARLRGAADLAEVEQGARAAIAAIPEAHTLPSFDQLLSDAEGRIWLRDFMRGPAGDVGSAWTVYGRDGVVERRVTTPAGLRVTHVGQEWITGVERDSLDVEYVVVYRLERGR
jgi:hypothetical protein